MTNIIVSGHGGLGTAIQRNLNMLLVIHHYVRHPQETLGVSQ